MVRYLFIFCFFLNHAVFANSHHPQEFLNDIVGKKNEGALIVQHFCSNCHARKPLIQLGAPRIGITADWEPRIKQGIDKLLQHTDEGLNAMPARGGCFECTDKQLILAIIEMLPPRLQKFTKSASVSSSLLPSL